MYAGQGMTHMGGISMMLGWVLVIGLVAVVIWLLVSGQRGGLPETDESPEVLLKRRYARGEIDREEYMRRLEDLRK